MGTSSTFQIVRTESSLTFQKCEKPNNGGHSDILTFQNGGKAPDGENDDLCDHCRRPGTNADPLLDAYDGDRECGCTAGA
jgi:hypothetical protein